MAIRRITSIRELVGKIIGLMDQNDVPTRDFRALLEQEIREATLPLPEDAEDQVRIFRLVEYVGPRSVMERQVANSIHGTKEFQKGSCRITAVTLGEYPEILQSAREAHVDDDLPWDEVPCNR
jgi:hypothetical protein